MFRCTIFPAEPSFPSNLPGLNMVLTTSSQPVDATTGAPFAFFHDASPRINDIRKEAFHTAMRGEMKLKLAELGVVEHFITDDNLLHDEKPAGKHVPVLMNSVSTVQNSRDVIILVGESCQDCGVFAWRLVREKEGLKRGTAVGLVQAVREFGRGLKAEDEEDDVHADDGPEGMSTPAVIILNPGQLFYSWSEGRAKTLVSWNDGERYGKMEEFPARIDEENQLEGHKTATEHVNTFIERILPEMINQRTRLYFIAIGDGAQHALAAVNKRLADKTVPPTISSQIEAVALICPQIITPASEFDPKLIFQLANEAKSWVCSNERLGECLATPTVIAGTIFGTNRGHHPTLSIDKDGHKKEDDVEEESKEKWDDDPPLVSTFSAGKSGDDGVTETAFESCMDHVLQFLWMRREQQLEIESIARKLERLKFIETNDAILAADHAENGDEKDSEGEFEEESEEDPEGEFEEASEEDPKGELKEASEKTSQKASADDKAEDSDEYSYTIMCTC